VFSILDRMSYNVAISTPPVPVDDDAAWGLLDSLIDAKGAVPSVFCELHDLLTAQCLCIRTLPDDKVDEGVWSDGPLWKDFGHRAAVLGMAWSRVEEVLPFLVRTVSFLIVEARLSIAHDPTLRFSWIQSGRRSSTRTQPSKSIVIDSEPECISRSSAG